MVLELLLALERLVAGHAQERLHLVRLVVLIVLVGVMMGGVACCDPAGEKPRQAGGVGTYLHMS